MTFSPGRSSNPPTFFSVAFTKLQAGVLVGGVFIILAVSFSLGFAAAGLRPGGEMGKERLVSRKGSSPAQKSEVATATVRLNSRDASRPTKLEGEKNEDTDIRPSFYTALLEKKNPMQEERSPLQLKEKSSRSSLPRPALPPKKEVRGIPRAPSGGDKRKKYTKRSAGPVKAPVLVRKAVQRADRREDILRKYTIQITSVQKAGRAIRITRTLRDKGFSAFLEAFELAGKGRWYRVRVGRFSDRLAARRVLGDLRSRSSAHRGRIVPL